MDLLDLWTKWFQASVWSKGNHGMQQTVDLSPVWHKIWSIESIALVASKLDGYEHNHYAKHSTKHTTPPEPGHTFLPLCSSHSQKEGMERLSPVQLAFLRMLTAWLCCCEGPKHQNHNSTCASLSAPMSRPSGLPVALSAPMGTFPHRWERKLPLGLPPRRGSSSSSMPCGLTQHQQSSLQFHASV